MANVERNDGGPAFPRSINEFSPVGMSLRDYFAGKMMARFNRNYSIDNIAHATNLAAEEARAAYLVADAMLAERAK